MELSVLSGAGDSLGDIQHLTLPQVVDLWYASKVGAWCPRRALNVRIAIRQLAPLIAPYRIADFLANDNEHGSPIGRKAQIVLSIRAGVAQAKYSPYWKNFLGQIVHAVMEWLCLLDVVSYDYSKAWKAFPCKEKDLKRKRGDFSHEEIEKLAAACHGDSVRRFIWSACILGSRKANLYPPAFVWRNVDDRWMWTIPAEDFKQGRSHQQPIPLKLRAILGERGEPDSPVIADLPHINSINDILKRAAKRSGLDPRSCFPHNFRRTTCRWMKESGVSFEDARDFLGWSNDDVVLRHYWKEQSQSVKWDIAEKL